MNGFTNAVSGGSGGGLRVIAQGQFTTQSWRMPTPPDAKIIMAQFEHDMGYYFVGVAFRGSHHDVSYGSQIIAQIDFSETQISVEHILPISLFPDYIIFG